MPIVIQASGRRWRITRLKEMTKRASVACGRMGSYDGWARELPALIGNNHNAIGRFYETFGTGGADNTRAHAAVRLTPNREWFRPNPPLAKSEVVRARTHQHARERDSFRHEQPGSHGPQFLK